MAVKIVSIGSNNPIIETENIESLSVKDLIVSELLNEVVLELKKQNIYNSMNSDFLIEDEFIEST